MSSLPLLLRAATADDAAQIADIYLASRRTFLPYAPIAHDEDSIRRWIATQLLPAGGVVVAQRGDAIAGFVACADEDGQAWINHLYLRPEHVSCGYGSVLLQHALASLAGPVHLYTFQANAGARRFYERHGFVAERYSDGADNEERCPDVLYVRRPIT